MRLTNIFKTFPSEMIFKSNLNGAEKTAKQWAEEFKSEAEDGYKVHESHQNYNFPLVEQVIYFPDVGPCFTSKVYKGKDNK